MALLPQGATGREAIHHRHLDVHQDQIGLPLADRVQSLLSIRGAHGFHTKLFQHFTGDLEVDGAVLHHQYQGTDLGHSRIHKDCATHLENEGAAPWGGRKAQFPTHKVHQMPRQSQPHTEAGATVPRMYGAGTKKAFLLVKAEARPAVADAEAQSRLSILAVSQPLHLKGHLPRSSMPHGILQQDTQGLFHMPFVPGDLCRQILAGAKAEGKALFTGGSIHALAQQLKEGGKGKGFLLLPHAVFLKAGYVQYAVENIHQRATALVDAQQPGVQFPVLHYLKGLPAHAQDLADGLAYLPADLCKEFLLCGKGLLGHIE